MSKIFINGEELITPKNINSLFHYETKVFKINNPINGSSVDITAPLVKGYTFQFWLQSTTSGTCNASYIQQPSKAQTRVWLPVITNNSDKICVELTAVYLKNS